MTSFEQLFKFRYSASSHVFQPFVVTLPMRHIRGALDVLYLATTLELGGPGGAIIRQPTRP